MWYLTIIRIAVIVFLGISSFRILIWVLSYRIPGGLRRPRIPQDSNCKKIGRIIHLYHFLLLFLIIISFIIVKHIVRGKV